MGLGMSATPTGISPTFVRSCVARYRTEVRDISSYTPILLIVAVLVGVWCAPWAQSEAQTNSAVTHSTDATIAADAFELRLSSMTPRNGYVAADPHPLSIPSRQIYVSGSVIASARDVVGAAPDTTCEGAPAGRGIKIFFRERAWSQIENATSRSLGQLVSILSYGRVIDTARLQGTFSQSLVVCTAASSDAEIRELLMEITRQTKGR